MLKKIIFKGYRRVQNISTPNKLSSRFMKQKTARVIRRNRNSLDVVSLNIPLLISFHSLWTLECVCVLVAQLCPTLCNPIDCTPPGPSVHGILQARTLEWRGDYSNYHFAVEKRAQKGQSSCLRSLWNRRAGTGMSCCCLVTELCLTLFVTPWTVAHQAPPSMGFSRQEYWSGLDYNSQLPLQ